jgi:ribosomal protein S18 acetylase RimI-like enzyme
VAITAKGLLKKTFLENRDALYPYCLHPSALHKECTLNCTSDLNVAKIHTMSKILSSVVSYAMNCEIRQLQEQEWALWKEIRLEALKLHPEAFTNTYEEESSWEDENFKKNLVENNIFGAFVSNKLLGVAGFFIYEPQKLKHQGLLFAMYVRKESRGKGVADYLVKAIINHARQRVIQLHCTVNSENKNALKLYQRHGFQTYGTAPRTVKLGEKFYDEDLMILMFDEMVGALSPEDKIQRAK